MGKPAPNIGPSDAGNKPDYVSVCWHDPRLKKEYQSIDNNQRFLGASQRIFEELCLFKGKTKDWFNKQWLSLKGDIAEAFGMPDQNQHLKQQRMQNYKKILGVDNQYFNELSHKGINIPLAGIILTTQQAASDHLWLNKAVESDMTGNYIFKKDYAKSDWYLFQLEIIRHQDDSYKILESLFDTTGQKNEWVKES